jgi:glycosyltransferase involved in cell wall biosynthesis
LNILFLTQVLPFPIDAGPKIRAYYNLRYLAEKHAVTLLSFSRPSDTPAALSHLKTICSQVEHILLPRSRFRDGLALVKSIFSGLPFLITRDEVPQMNLSIKKIIQDRQFDAIHADQLWMAPYAIKAQKEAIKYGYHPRLILDQHNAVHLIPKRMAETSPNRFLRAWLVHEAKAMARFELQTCRQFDHVVWVTHEDLDAVNANSSTGTMKARYIEDEFSSNKNTIIPICTDSAEIPLIDRLPETRDILFVGGMHWPPNADGVTWFVQEVLPRVLADQPQARFLAVGKQPPAFITSREKQVIAPGYVENIESYWKNARVFVVPIRAGGGMRVKILDAWARGIPVVSTTIGAEGISYQPGKDIVIADTAEDFALAVKNILTEDNLAQSLSQTGRRALEHHYDWRKIYPAWDAIYP